MNSLINRYDNEFIGLLNEIGNRLIYFKKEETSKIKSWIKLLSFPYESIEEKQNRNLYAIKLVNQMINHKIKSPFNKYPNSYELKPILAIDVKAELTKKFYQEINMKNIINYGYQKQIQFLNSYLNNNDDINESNKNLTYKFDSINCNNENNINNSDIDIIRKNNQLREEKNTNDYQNDFDIKLIDKDNEQLYNIIEELENKLSENDKIIETQSFEINKLSNYLEKLINQISLKKNNE